MTAGKVLIDGTAYDIKGGKTLIDGTAYDIKGGKTLIGGTACDISFAPPREQTMQALLQDVTVKSNVGRNASSTSSITLSFNAAFPYPLYVLSFCNGYMSVNKVTWDGSSFTKTIIHQDSTSYGNIYTDNTNKRIRYSNNGSSSTSVRAATLLALSLNNYTTSEADSIFSSATYTRFAGRNSSSTGTVYEFIDTGTHYYFAAVSADVGFSALEVLNVFQSSAEITNYFGTSSTNPSLLYYSFYSGGYRASLSTSGISATSVYGGSIIEVS